MTNDVTFRSDMTVELIDSMGGEESIVRAARVSTLGAESKDSESNKGLIKYLYRNHHGSPFEHNSMTFYIESPLFVGRQILRHRTSSFNEESGRYKEMEGVFYIADPNRPLQQVGKVGNYEFVEGDPSMREAVEWVQKNTTQSSWDNYLQLKSVGVANEVARMHLPVNLYSSMYLTTNLRSILNFLSLRKNWGEDAVHVSKPQYEIELVAEKIAEIVKEKYPTVWEAFVESGYQRV